MDDPSVYVPEGVPSKTMYRVQKFTPRNCPQCNRLFDKSGEDWGMYLGKIINGMKVPDPEYPRIICGGCQSLVPIVKLEEYQVGDKAFAEKLVAEDGFFDLIEVIAVGNMCQDCKITYGDEQPKLIVIPITQEPPSEVRPETL